MQQHNLFEEHFDTDLLESDSAPITEQVDRFTAYLAARAAGLDSVDVANLGAQVRRAAPVDAPLTMLREIAIHNAAGRTFEEPGYSRLAARLLAHQIREEVAPQTFTQAMALGHRLGIVNARVMALVEAHGPRLDASIHWERDSDFEYFGLKTLRDRYLLKHPQSRAPIETPQFFFMRVAVGVSDTLDQVLELYELFSRLEYMPSSPTLFNAGTHREQLSSCFLLDSPADDLRDIYKRYTDIAMLSKFAGGIGLAYTRVRSAGSHIQGTNGASNGIVPFLKTLDASVAAVNQGGKRKGACAVYLEPWHADIECFLELRDNTGDEARRTHNLNLANWLPDLFMKRVWTGEMWSLMDPAVVPELVDLYGDDFDQAYIAAELAGKFTKRMPARELYERMMRTLAQTGNGWICFKDKSNKACNQTGEKGRAVHLSNLCTEIIEVTNGEECAVCNLGSINLSRHVSPEGFDYDKLAETVHVAVRQLDRVIDRNLYTIPEAEHSNLRWRPVGLGSMGTQDVFFTLRLPFDSAEARAVNKRIAETIYFHALDESCRLAQQLGPHPTFADTRAAKGELQFDAWGVTPTTDLDWDGLRQRIQTHGLRNSLLLAIAPTATIASVVGCNECTEPQVSNLFKRETLSGEFLLVNKHLVSDLKRLGLWNPDTRGTIKANRGSVQQLDGLPAEFKLLYRTAWELSMRSLIDLAADRGAFIDQSQSLNLFMEKPSIGKLSSMYMYAWKAGLKTTYYLRSRPATEISGTAKGGGGAKKVYSAAEQLACSLENPEACEACQ